MMEYAYINDGNLKGGLTDPFPTYELQGYSALNNLTFTLPDFDRNMEVNMRSFAIMQSNNHAF